MLLGLARRWWLLLLNGIAAIIFGFIAFTRPQIGLVALVFLFGIYAFADGLTAISAWVAARDRTGESWWQMLVIGLFGILAGFATFIWPGITAIVLLGIIAAWAIIHGILEIAAAIKLRKYIKHEWLLILAGLCFVLFGAVLLARPGLGALAMVRVIGIFAIIHGFILVALSFRVKGVKNMLESAGGPSARAA